MRQRIGKLFDKACKCWGVTVTEVLGSCRKQPLPLVRAMIAKTLRDNHSLTLEEIGGHLNRHHTTVIYYFKIFDAEYKYNKEFRNFANAMKDIDNDIQNEFAEELEHEFNEVYR
jgi:chromosomal replication initiation ATPase DnaA